VHSRSHVAAHVRTLLVQHHQLFGLPDRQLSQQNLIEKGEDGCVGADSEGERQNRDRREERVANEPAQSKPQVTGGGHAHLGRSVTP
jgi:hypothetical protein